mmetsp:Transcript_16585/g.29021  ORF Transcript_16585/g.29021 Transcript_16585/m.29021 type:complete len:107 (+) Transcript_16585:68-388(+)
MPLVEMRAAVELKITDSSRKGMKAGEPGRCRTRKPRLRMSRHPSGGIALHCRLARAPHPQGNACILNSLPNQIATSPGILNCCQFVYCFQGNLFIQGAFLHPVDVP